MPDPIVPVAELAVDPVVPAVEAPDAEDAEWDAAAKEVYPGLEEKDAKKEEDEKTDDKTEEKKDEIKPEDVKPADEAKPADEVKPVEPAATAPSSTAEARATQEAVAQEFDAVKRDVALEVFKDLPLVLKDADGDTINGVDDVMKLIDPRTGESFTEEAATAWYLQVNQQLQKNISDADEQANRITSINISLKDQADRLMREFEPVLKANPDKFGEIWAEFSKTLKVAPGGKVVIDAPVSLYSFAKTALAPYADVAKAQAEAAEAKQKAEKAEKAQSRISRSDIFGTGKLDTMTQEEKEWAQAAKDYFEK